MKVYVNNLGITCVEPDEGYLLKKGDMICKKAYLGINDRAELYEQIIDFLHNLRNLLLYRHQHLPIHYGK